MPEFPSDRGEEDPCLDIELEFIIPDPEYSEVLRDPDDSWFMDD